MNLDLRIAATRLYYPESASGFTMIIISYFSNAVKPDPVRKSPPPKAKYLSEFTMDYTTLRCVFSPFSICTKQFTPQYTMERTFSAV